MARKPPIIGPMTEAEWLSPDVEPERMLQFLRTRASERKLRLFAVACCRRILHLMTDPRSRAAVEVADRYADGAAGEAEREAAWEAADQAATDVFDQTLEIDGVISNDDSANNAAVAAENAVEPAEGFVGREAEVEYLTMTPVAAVACQARERGRDGAAADREETAVHIALIRDIFGNPFRPVSFRPEWRTETAVALARRMYEGRDFSAMPILADALQDAGCEDAGVLDHCRGRGPHVRGCWVVDWLLGKE